MRDRLVHIRTIHFALVILSSLSAYLAWSVGPGSPGTYRQLTQLEHLVARVSASTPDPSAFTADWKNAVRSAQWLLERAPPVEVPAAVRVHPSPFPLNSEMPVAELIQHLDSYKIAVDVPYTPLEAERFGQFQEGVRATLATCGDAVAHTWTAETVVLKYRCVRYSLSDSRYALPIPFEAEFEMRWRTYVLALPDTWKTQFDLLTADKGVMNLSLADALNNVGPGRSRKLSPQEFDLLGVKVSNVHVGVVGPLTVFLVALYLAVMADDTRRVLARPFDVTQTSPTPWIGTMSGALPRVLVAATLVALPTFATGFSLSRLVLPVPSVWLCALPTCVASAFSAWCSLQIQRAFTKSASQVRAA